MESGSGIRYNIVLNALNYTLKMIQITNSYMPYLLGKIVKIATL